jgi:hypothetical protein
MSKLDLNRDGEVSEAEILKVLNSINTSFTRGYLNTSVE